MLYVDENGKLVFRNSQGKTIDLGSPEGAIEHTLIIFRDNDERDYWDSMTLALARKGDATSQSVVSAADELVEERRARMQSEGIGNVVQRAFAVAELLRQRGIHVAAVNRMVNGESRAAIAFGHEQNPIVCIDKPRHFRMSIEDLADAAVDAAEMLRQKTEALKEVTEELMNEAARQASDSGDYSETMNRLGLTDLQKRQIGDTPHTWGWIVLSYLAGALHKARE
jgi:hypothetical protein